MGKLKDLTRQKFGRLSVVERANAPQKAPVTWNCVCECGNSIAVIAYSLTSGNTQSCGCIQREILLKRNTVHALSKDKSGKKKRLYNIWVRMRQRCNDANTEDYARYGARGISVCDEWNDFALFHDWAMENGYRNNLTIERINNDGNYEPSNCKWITNAEQARSKSNNHLVTFKGKTKTLAEWSEIYGIESSLLRYRLKHWDAARALTAPVRRGRHEANIAGAK